MNRRHRMPYLVGILIIIIMLLGWVGSSSVDRVADLTEDLYEHPLVVSMAVLRINGNVISMHRALKDIVLAESQEAVNRYRGIVNQTEERILADFSLVEERFLGDSGEVHAAKRAFLAWKPIREEVLRLVLEGKKGEAARVTQTTGDTQVAEIETRVQALRDFSRGKSQEFLRNAKETRAQTLRFVWLALACSLILAGVIAYKAIHLETNLQELNGQLDRKVRERTADLGIANENLSAQYEEITAMNEELTAQNEEIISINNELEHRVNERTSELMAANQELIAQYDELQQFQESLRASEENFRTFFDSVSEGVALHEMIYESGKAVDYRVTRTNPAYEMHTGLVPEQVWNRLATEIYQAAPPYLNEFSLVAETGEPCVLETFFPPMNKYFRISAVSTQPGQFATIFEDISDRIRQESELRRKNEEMSSFVYTVSHDLRSPLVTIKAFLGYLEQDVKDKEFAAAEQDMVYIRNAADKMATLLDELLNLSRIGSKPNLAAEISLRDLAGEVLDLVAGRIDERGVRVTLSEEQVLLYGDVARLRDLYQNLIDNAVKFMGDQPEPVIEISARQDPTGITLFVRDNGSGIDPRHQKKLFGLFEKLDKTTDGAGMGLAIAKRIVEIHGGTIWVESGGAGTGSTFYFTLARTHFGTEEGGTTL